MKSKEQKKVEEAERLAYWRSLGVSQKVAALDARLGVGVGAKKQRKQLNSVWIAL